MGTNVDSSFVCGCSMNRADIHPFSAFQARTASGLGTASGKKEWWVADGKAPKGSFKRAPAPSTNPPEQSAGGWKFGTSAQIPDDKRATTSDPESAKWKVVEDEKFMGNIAKAMDLAKKWLSSDKWQKDAANICVEWNMQNGFKDNDVEQWKIEAEFKHPGSKLASSLVDNALVFDSLESSAEADALTLGRKPYKIALYNLTFARSRVTLQKIPLELVLGKAVIHELMHHYTRWGHAEPRAWMEKDDPIYAITQAILLANGVKEFEYDNKDGW